MSSICRKFLVSGTVQMVGFRYHTAHQGLKFGLTGYAKNLNDGSVEVFACGAKEQVEQLAQWLKVGPRTASVESCIASEAEFKHYAGFDIL
ncbi:acylphosphatase [Vibrio ezurae]|uniref:acylphosphatase n=1 Tax=Vibrio ezurae NBRC 102218 TaxID=1219080 RepID=U3B0C9_9VIBR|nr:acylphosphatase [Vibrio ezurae]GAD79435.1 putative acylphosphatase [Vibrio ezurae NBRC 102218]